MRSPLSLSLAVTIASCAGSASASPDYPSILASTLSLRAPPDCTVCHQSEAGGYGTVTTPFGRAMQGFGLHAGSPSSLAQAIEASRAHQQDSDGDGVSDLDELVAGTDPNDGPGADALPEGPQYGCAVGAARTPGASGWVWIVMGVCAAYRARRAAHTRRARTR